MIDEGNFQGQNRGMTLTMCIKKYLINRMATSVTKLDKWQHRIMPMLMRRLDKEVFNSGHWCPT